MNILNLILLDAAAGQTAGMDFSGILMIVAMIAIFYFFMIRPQSKKQKELKKQREAMKKGDRVITNGGIYGKIVTVKDNTLVIEIAPNVEIKVDKGCVFPAAEQAENK